MTRRGRCPRRHHPTVIESDGAWSIRSPLAGSLGNGSEIMPTVDSPGPIRSSVTRCHGTDAFEDFGCGIVEPGGWVLARVWQLGVSHRINSWTLQVGSFHCWPVMQCRQQTN